MSGFRPDIEVIDHGLAVDRHVEDAHAFAINQRRTRTVPRRDEVQLDPVLAVRHLKPVVQLVTPETEGLEQFPVARATDGVVRRALAGKVGIQLLEVLRP